jgi:hypothetical protein
MGFGEKHIKEITGRPAEEELSITIEDFSDSAVLGEIVEVIYRSHKSHLKDKEPVLYKHKFNKGTLLISNGKQLLVWGKDLKINYRGIIN